MRKPLRIQKTWLIALAITIVALGTVVSVLVFATGDSRLTVKGYSDVVRFEAAGVAILQVQIYDLSGKEVWDSGMVAGNTVDWNRRNESGERMAYGAYLYVAQGWEAGGGLSFKKNGKIALMPGDKVQLQQAPEVTSSRSEENLTPFADDGLTVQPKEVINESLTVNGYIRLTGKIYKLDDTGHAQVTGGSSYLRGAYFAMYGDDSVAPGNFYMAFGSANKDLNSKLYFQYRDTIGVYTHMVLDKYGKLGIGTTSPSAKLEIEATSGDLIAAYNSSERVFVVKNSGEVRADGTVYAADFITGGSADVAERINVSEWVEAGNVIEIDPEHIGFFRKSTSAYSKKVAGIISTSPGVILGNNFDEATDNWEDDRPVLAVTGRVPCKVTTENGPIAIGDLLVASSIPGVAMKGDLKVAVGSVVGKAMEPLEEGTGVIMAQVTLR